MQYTGLMVSLGDIAQLAMDESSPVWHMLCLVVVGEEKNGEDYGLLRPSRVKG